MGSVEGLPQLSDPTQYATGTIVIPEALLNDPCPFYVNLADKEKYYSKEPLVPYIAWTALPEGITTADGINEGWTLWLTGLEGNCRSNPLGYAYNDDSEGLRDLVRLLEDRDALYSLATLVVPEIMGEATKQLAIFKILSKYEKYIFLNNYYATSKTLRSVFRTEIYSVDITDIQGEHVVYTFSLAPLFWKGIFPTVTEWGQRRNEIKGLRKILRKTKLNLIADPNGINTQNVSLTALSIEDWNKIVKILSKNPIREFAPKDVKYLDPQLFEKRKAR